MKTPQAIDKLLDWNFPLALICVLSLHKKRVFKGFEGCVLTALDLYFKWAAFFGCGRVLPTLATYSKIGLYFSVKGCFIDQKFKSVSVKLSLSDFLKKVIVSLWAKKAIVNSRDSILSPLTVSKLTVASIIVSTPE